MKLVVHALLCEDRTDPEFVTIFIFLSGFIPECVCVLMAIIFIMNHLFFLRHYRDKSIVSTTSNPCQSISCMAFCSSFQVCPMVVV